MRKDIFSGLIVIGFVVVGLAAYQVGTLASPVVTQNVTQTQTVYSTVTVTGDDIMLSLQEGRETEQWWFKVLPNLTGEAITVRVRNTVFQILPANMTCIPDPERFYFIPCGYVVIVSFPNNATYQFRTSVERSQVRVTEDMTIASIGLTVVDGKAVHAMIRTVIQDNKSTIYLLSKQ